MFMNLFQTYYDEVKKLNLDDDTLFLRPGQLKGEDHNSTSRLSMRNTWQYRTGARFFQRCSERLRKKYGKDFTQCYRFVI